MSYLKCLTTGILSTLLAVNVYAESNKIRPTVEHKATVQNAPSSAKETNQKRFNDTVALKFYGYEFAKDPAGRPMLNFKYSIENKTGRNIRVVQWAVDYIHNGKVILTQSSPVTFKDLLKRRTTAELAFAVPVDELPAEAQKVFQDPNARLTAQFKARQIVFSNGTKIIVK